MRTEFFNSEVYIVLFARNFGKIPITLAYAYTEEVLPLKQKILSKFRPKQKDNMSDVTERINSTVVKIGTSVAIPILIYEINQNWLKNKVDLQGVVVDQLGREYRSKVIKDYKYPFYTDKKATK